MGLRDLRKRSSALCGFSCGGSRNDYSLCALLRLSSFTRKVELFLNFPSGYIAIERDPHIQDGREVQCLTDASLSLRVDRDGGGRQVNSRSLLAPT